MRLIRVWPRCGNEESRAILPPGLAAHPDDPQHDAMAAAAAASHAANPAEAQRLIGTVSDPVLRSEFEKAQQAKKAANQGQAAAGS